MNQLDRIATEWLAARDVIAAALLEWGTTKAASVVRAEAIIARLAAHDPPILLEMDRPCAAGDKFDLRALADGAAAAWDDAPKSHQPILRDCSDALTEAADDIERLQEIVSSDCASQDCGHAAKWLAYRDPINPRSERYCLFCEVQRLHELETAAAEFGRMHLLVAGAMADWPANLADDCDDAYVRLKALCLAAAKARTP
jgi:hypothetical protein